jgi:hypothetical protein
MSFFDDFRRGLNEARAAQAARTDAMARKGDMFSDVYPGPPPQRSDFRDGLFGPPPGAHGAPDFGSEHGARGSSWEPEPHGFQPPPQREDPRLAALATLCEQQEADLAAIGERLEQYVAAVAERDAAIGTLQDQLEKTRATRDRYQAEMTQWRSHIASIEKLGFRAMSKAAHPDTAPPEQRPAREELFKLVKTIFERT